MRRLAPVPWNGGQVLTLLVLRPPGHQEKNGLRVSTLELRPVPGTGIHVPCHCNAPLVAIAPIKRSVNTRAHVRAPFHGTKIKRGTGTSNSYFQKSYFQVLSFDAKQDLLQLWFQSMVFNLVVKPNQRFTQNRINKSEFEMFH